MSSGLSLKNRIIVSIAKWAVRILVSTYRIDWVCGQNKFKSLNGKSKPMIMALWHNRTVFLSLLLKQLVKQEFPVTIMISLSKDGEMGARLGEELGAKVVRGSPTRGGTQGLRALYRSVVKEKSSIVILPDGSKGPIYEAKSGMIVLAKMTKTPVLPISCYAQSSWRLRSWDRMIVPKPFSRIVINVGDEIEIAPDASADRMESSRLEIQNSLNSLGEDVETFYSSKQETVK